MIRFGNWLQIAAGIYAGVAAPYAKAETLLTPRETAELATSFADALRAWPVASQSVDGVDVGSPVLMVSPGPAAGEIEGTVEALVSAMHVRLGSKVRFVRRDQQGPSFLTLSKRLDYESRLLYRPAGGGKAGPSTEWVLELYEPAGTSPVFSIGHVMSQSGIAVQEEVVSPRPKDLSSERRKEDEGQDRFETERRKKQEEARQRSEQRRQEEDRRREEKRRLEEARKRTEDSRKAAETTVKKQREDAGKQEDRSARQRESEKKTPQRVLPFQLGHIYIKDKKTAERLVVLTEGSQILTDGRLEVHVSLVCRKDNRKVRIRASFYNSVGECVERAPETRYELAEGSPHTVRIPSRREAARFVLEIDKD